VNELVLPSDFFPGSGTNTECPYLSQVWGTLHQCLKKTTNSYKSPDENSMSMIKWNQNEAVNCR
jgi:hypothetical protein